jgi:hypothetical protein
MDAEMGNMTTKANAICDMSGMAMTMLMDGFAPSWDKAEGCLIFLFENYNVNTVSSLVGTYFLTLLIALIEHGIEYGRRAIKAKCATSAGVTILDSVLYALKIGAAYFLMLIAMTYRTDLFICVLLSLCIGHAVFHGEIFCKVCGQKKNNDDSRTKTLLVERKPSEGNGKAGRDEEEGGCCGTD